MPEGAPTKKARPGRLAPGRQQYLQFRQQYPDALLLFRMGDFYELFLDDAKVAAEFLGLTLTSRNKNETNAVPMCGVPYHAARTYILPLVEAGHKVAIAEQMEEASAAKGLVRRDVVRVITAGVAWDADDLTPREPCWLVAIHERKGVWGWAGLDVSTGELRLGEHRPSKNVLEEVLEDVLRVQPKEAVVAEGGSAQERLKSLRWGWPLS
jgi:DNA mismatch repair protein MutS